jgi:hypothetical protein
MYECYGQTMNNMGGQQFNQKFQRHGWVECIGSKHFWEEYCGDTILHVIVVIFFSM